MDNLELLIEGRAAVRSGRGRELRLLAGLSQAELAELVGVTPAAISRWEAGDRRPTGDRAIAYATALHRIAEQVTASV